MKPKILSKKEKKNLLEEMKEKFGLEKQDLKYLFIKTGKNRIRGFSGILSREEISILMANLNIELIGVYLFRQEQQLRLSHDAVSLLRKKIKKSIVEVSDKEASRWLKGEDIDIKNNKIKKGIVILKNKDDLIGIGKSSGEKIFNFVPKERRIKN